MQYSCSSPYNVSLENGDTVVVKDIDTCKQGNSNDGLDFDPSLSSRDFVILLESSEVARQISVSSTSTSSNSHSVQVISQQCSINQTSDTVDHLSVEGGFNLSLEGGYNDPAQDTLILLKTILLLLQTLHTLSSTRLREGVALEKSQLKHSHLQGITHARARMLFQWRLVTLWL
uniref:Uncharacterized protein n=1 Tax=Dunaliella tertiolecta TaxID=3047 RepID=A0A7S3R7Z2_DUNTE